MKESEHIKRESMINDLFSKENNDGDFQSILYSISNQKNENSELKGKIDELLKQESMLKSLFPGDKNFQSLYKSISKQQKENEELKTKENEFVKQETMIKELFPDEQNIQSICDSILRQQNEFEEIKESQIKIEKVIKSIPCLNSNQSSLDSLNKIKQIFTKLNSICESSDIVNEVLKMKKNLDKLKSSASKSNKNDEDIIESFISQSKKLKEIESKIHFGILKGNNNNNSDYYDENSDIDVIDELIHHHQILSKISEFLNCKIEYSDSKSGNQIINIIQSNQNNLKDLSNLIDTFCSILFGMNFSLNLPITSHVKNKLIESVSEFKQRSDKEHEENESIMNFSRERGFIVQKKSDSIFKEKSILREAVDFLIQTAVDKEKSSNIEMMHKEVTEVRQIAQKERKIFDERKEKLNKKISDLRSSSASLQEKFIQQKDELVNELEAVKSELRKVSIDLESEKRIREELLRIISGQGADVDFLRSKLNDNEFASLKKKNQQK